MPSSRRAPSPGRIPGDVLVLLAHGLVARPRAPGALHADDDQEDAASPEHEVERPHQAGPPSPSRARISACTTAAFAWPRVSFITWPTKESDRLALAGADVRRGGRVRGDDGLDHRPERPRIRDLGKTPAGDDGLDSLAVLQVRLEDLLGVRPRDRPVADEPNENPQLGRVREQGMPACIVGPSVPEPEVLRRSPSSRGPWHRARDRWRASPRTARWHRDRRPARTRHSHSSRGFRDTAPGGRRAAPGARPGSRPARPPPHGAAARPAPGSSDSRPILCVIPTNSPPRAGELQGDGYRVEESVKEGRAVLNVKGSSSSDE